MVIETNGLTFNFGNQTVVKNLSLQVPEGSIYGFLGPNGAGKTTTIKILLNLLQTQSGDVKIFGLDFKGHRKEILKQVGSLIEQPAIYAHLTGRENLANRALLLQVPESRVDEMLALVKLTQAAGKKAGAYSLGMKQRLGIALAMISDPKLLMLDEPTNGLDPNGIIEIRELLIDLTRNHGKTVFISSHLLGEVERMATHVGIINFGEMLFQGPIKDLQSISQPLLLIETSSTVDAANLLNKNGFDVIEVKEGLLTLAFQSKELSAAANSLLNQNGYPVYSIHKVQKDLEKLFLDITQKSA